MHKINACIPRAIRESHSVQYIRRLALHMLLKLIRYEWRNERVINREAGERERGREWFACNFFLHSDKELAADRRTVRWFVNSRVVFTHANLFDQFMCVHWSHHQHRFHNLLSSCWCKIINLMIIHSFIQRNECFIMANGSISTVICALDCVAVMTKFTQIIYLWFSNLNWCFL